MASALTLRVSLETESHILSANEETVTTTPKETRSQYIWTVVVRGSNRISLKGLDDNEFVGETPDGEPRIIPNVESAILFEVDALNDGRWLFRTSRGKFLRRNATTGHVLFSDTHGDDATAWTVHLASVPTASESGPTGRLGNPYYAFLSRCVDRRQSTRASIPPQTCYGSLIQSPRFICGVRRRDATSDSTAANCAKRKTSRGAPTPS